MKRPTLTTALLLCSLATLAANAQARRMASSNATSVPTMMMGTHMQMSVKSEPKKGDAERAAHIADIARGVLDHYNNVNTALADGYHPFLATNKIGDEIHFINPRLTMAEQRNIDYKHPGALLYEKTATGYKITGVMYMAPASSSSSDLNARAPLSVAPWHRHVDICTPQNGVPNSSLMDPEAQFGFLGTIHTDAECRAAGGHFAPLLFGWMTHVYPNETDPSKVWGGAKMMMDMD